MSRRMKIRISNDGVKGFFDRAREHARKLDRGEELAPEMTISFENASDMMRILSPQRVRVLRVARQGAAPVSALASGLNRDTRAVSRDVDLLEQFGLLRTWYRRTPDMASAGSWSLVPQNSSSSRRSSLTQNGAACAAPLTTKDERTRTNYYVPSLHPARYSSCSGVRRSILIPIDSSFNLATRLSRSSGTL